MLDKLAPCQILVVGCWQLNHLTSDISYYLLSGSGDPKDVFCNLSVLWSTIIKSQQPDHLAGRFFSQNEFDMSADISSCH